ncbi:MAG: glutathione S-transferase family protein [Rhodospirillales bacterium]|nr:glutathione S-transferase family protein [Rhodospirillales bacterium]
MKLRSSSGSPFVRKVWVAALETGIADGIERIMVSPINPEDVKSSPSPLGKIPCLETDDGMVLYDSPVIMDYFSSLLDDNKLIPPGGKARWDTLRRQALGDGMLGSTVNVFIEKMRKPERQSKGWIVHNKAAVDRAIDSLESEVPDMTDVIDAGTITLAVALAFFDQHFPDDSWRADHPKLAAWSDDFNQRPSMRTTVLGDM